MNRLYIIFPHCYIKATSKELLIYDTIKFSSIYMRNIAVPYKAVNTLNQFGYIDDCDDNKSILQKSPTTDSDISYNQTSQCLISPNEDYK